MCSISMHAWFYSYSYGVLFGSCWRSIITLTRQFRREMVKGFRSPDSPSVCNHSNHRRGKVKQQINKQTNNIASVIFFSGYNPGVTSQTMIRRHYFIPTLCFVQVHLYMLHLVLSSLLYSRSRCHYRCCKKQSAASWKYSCPK